MFIPGPVVAALTFPGVMVHEAAHQLMCRWLRVGVYEVCYFRFGDPAGYVLHEPPRSSWHSLLIGIAPFLVSSIVGAAIAFPAVPAMEVEGVSAVDVFLLWLGISIAMHAFPSTGDAATIWQAIRASDTPWLLRIVASPIVLLIHLGAIGSVMWLDAIYGGMVCIMPPLIVIRAMT